MRKTMMITVAVASAVALSIPSEAADVFPSHPITVVVPFAAGGPLDTLVRIMSERLTAELGQNIVIENLAGAGGSTGVGHVVRAAADGYTLCAGNWSTHVVNASVYALNYDLVADQAPVALLTSNPQLIVARKSMPAHNLQELVGWVKANRANLGTAGVGSASHVSGLFLQQRTGQPVSFVHHKGGGPALQDVIAGHLDIMFDQSSTSLPHVKDGAIKAFAVTSKARLGVAPDIPTVDEAGLPGFYISVWSGIWAPGGTPASVIARLNEAFNHVLDNPSVSKRLAALGAEMPASNQRTPEALADLQRVELAKWTPIIKSATK